MASVKVFQGVSGIIREYVFNANFALRAGFTQQIKRWSFKFWCQFALSTYSRNYFPLDSQCPSHVIIWLHVRAIYGGEGFWRADQTDGHRHGAGAVTGHLKTSQPGSNQNRPL